MGSIERHWDNKLSSESVKGSSLSLEGVDDIHGGDGLSLGVLAVGDGISDDVLEEHLQNSTSLLVDEAGDSLDSSTTGKTTDGGLGDSLDVITQHLAMALGSSLSESLSSLSTTRHVDAVDVCCLLLLLLPLLYQWPRQMSITAVCALSHRPALSLLIVSRLSQRCQPHADDSRTEIGAKRLATRHTLTTEAEISVREV